MLRAKYLLEQFFLWKQSPEYKEMKKAEAAKAKKVTRDIGVNTDKEKDEADGRTGSPTEEEPVERSSYTETASPPPALDSPGPSAAQALEMQELGYTEKDSLLGATA